MKNLSRNLKNKIADLNIHRLTDDEYNRDYSSVKRLGRMTDKEYFDLWNGKPPEENKKGNNPNGQNKA